MYWRSFAYFASLANSYFWAVLANEFLSSINTFGFLCESLTSQDYLLFLHLKRRKRCIAEFCGIRALVPHKVQITAIESGATLVDASVRTAIRGISLPMVAHATYSKALITKGYGHPLWKPDPGECGPVEIADVGYISNGGFTRLFSTSTKSDLSNRHGLPEGHRPLTVGDIRYQTPLPKQPEYISSEGVQRKGTNITISAG